MNLPRVALTTFMPKNDLLLSEIDYNLANLSPYDIYYLKQIRNIRVSLPWIIFALGLLGNIFILFIFLRKSRLRSSNGICFSALAISDSIALVFMLLRSLLKLQVVGNVSVACKFIKFIYYASLQVSSWCLVILTIDRLIAVVFIFKYNNWSKKFYALKLLIATIITILILNSHLLIFLGARKIKNQSSFNPLQQLISEIRVAHGSKRVPEDLQACYVDPEEYPIYYKYFYSKWDIAHAIVYGMVPFFIIFVCNIVIIWKLMTLRKNNLTKSTIKKTKTLKVDPTIKSIQITVMLLSVAFLFLIFTSPVSIYMSIFYENLKNIPTSKREYIKVVLRYIGYFNNAINFYVYFSLSSEFRKEFIKTIRSYFKCFNFCKETTALCTTTTTLGSNDSLSSDSLRPGSNRSKAVYRKKKSNYTTTERFIKQKTLSSSLDASETFKENTKKAKLIYYKEPNFSSINKRLNTSEKTDTLSNEPFINSNPTFV